jgi:hypothetical protein
MRRDVCLGLLALAALVAAGCDSDSPLSVETQTAELSIRAIGAQVNEYQVWDLVEDSDGIPGGDDVNGDGVDGDITLWCRSAGLGSPTSVPWGFSVKVQVIRDGEIVISEQGQVVPQQLTSDDAEETNTNRAVYDTFEGTNNANINPISVTHPRGHCSTKPQINCNPLSTSEWCADNDGGQCIPVFSCSDDFDSLCDPTNPGTTCSSQGAGVCTSAGVCSGDPGIVCEPTCADLGLGTCIHGDLTRKYFFQTTNRRALTAASREILNAADNFIAETCEGDPACEAEVEDGLNAAVDPPLGVCPGQDLGDPAFDPFTADGNPDPTIFGFTLDKGDTVIVESRRSDETPGGGQIIEFFSEPGLLAEFFVDGSALQSDEITGSLVSTDPESPSISFSFTSK